VSAALTEARTGTLDELAGRPKPKEVRGEPAWTAASAPLASRAVARLTHHVCSSNLNTWKEVVNMLVLYEVA
jgi:hypothetical protein